MRSIRAIHKAVYEPIRDLKTFRAMPTHSIDQLDPFLFLNHHGPQIYPPNNHGLPFGPHPHRGFETLTFIFKGDIMHWDSGGHKSVIKEGGIQWMTAGSGLIHSEISSEEFLKNGGEEEVIQLWFNLPAKLKMTPPNYMGRSKEEIPQIALDGGRATVNLVSGKWGEITGTVPSLTNITIASVELQPTGQFSLDIPQTNNILLYVVKGKIMVNGKAAKMHDLVEFAQDHEQVNIEAQEGSLLIVGHAQPFNEPIVAHGPFVMNSEAEIRQAFFDYQSGKMGKWVG
jgi:quercetin 2,3-dioxygenase